MTTRETSHLRELKRVSETAKMLQIIQVLQDFSFFVIISLMSFVSRKRSFPHDKRSQIQPTIPYQVQSSLMLKSTAGQSTAGVQNSSFGLR